MINEITNYRCKCNKCNHLWTTKTFDVPGKCPKCKRVTWNEGSEPAPRIEMPQAPTIAEPSNDTQTKLERARAALMSVESRVSAPVAEVVTDNWIEMPTTIENGETLYWHRKIKGAPVCYKRETNWDNFA